MGGSDEAQLAIHDSRNCGWVHQEHCHAMAEGGDGRIRAIMYLIRYEGYINVCKFALEMATLSPHFREAADINRAWEHMLQRQEWFHSRNDRRVQEFFGSQESLTLRCQG